MRKIMANFDLKREDGKFVNLKINEMDDAIKRITKEASKDSIVTIYVELRKSKEFKEKSGGEYYKLKGPKGA